MADKKIRIGLIGCGRISGNHIQAITDHADACELVAVCDPEKDRADEKTAETGAPAFYDIDQMLASVEMDAVAICSPSGMHDEHAIAVANAGMHVITEKPMAITLEGCDRMITACDQNQVSLFVVKQNRLNTTMQLLKRAVDKGRFGRIYGAYVNVFWQRPQEYYDMAKWRGTWEFDGGAFMNQASHYVDSLHWLIGEVDSVMAMTGTLGRNIEAEDSGSAVIRFRNGTIGSMNVSMLTYPKNLEGSVTILGENGTVKLGGVAINKFEKWEFAEYDDDDKLVEESNYQPPNVYGFGHTTYYKNVIDSLRGDAPPATDGRSGRKSLELILAIYKSAREGKRVPLPLT
ncbi:MAG: UDP-N-acetyl-2-amino-2-deoxyglucuronate dehydrogenase [Kiritimatiellia bacterium]|jgi:UDP-N-acetyl-2-amino-2-deoxyglucuronate dehydrogenase